MTFTIAVADTGTIDLADGKKKPKGQYKVEYNEKFVATETPEKVIVFDPRKDIVLQVNANAQALSIWTTSHAGLGNLDILDAAVPWVLLKEASVVDYHSGSSLENRGILAVKIQSDAQLTDDFEIFAAQYGQED